MRPEGSRTAEWKWLSAVTLSGSRFSPLAVHFAELKLASLLRGGWPVGRLPLFLCRLRSSQRLVENGAQRFILHIFQQTRVVTRKLCAYRSRPIDDYDLWHEHRVVFGIPQKLRGVFLLVVANGKCRLELLLKIRNLQRGHGIDGRLQHLYATVGVILLDGIEQAGRELAMRAIRKNKGKDYSLARILIGPDVFVGRGLNRVVAGFARHFRASEGAKYRNKNQG